jgi:hypothetical protein
MAEKKTCFIIMPITIPELFLSQYRDDNNHFKHVLEHLFIPSVEKADFRAISPIAKGADLIHAEIIRNLEQSDLVLCDMSCPNPNVFFELGIRTALNKPVCIVKDEFTKKIPFDLSILNYHEYLNTLESWEIRAEVENLAIHIGVSAERSKGLNTLWKNFGLRNEAYSRIGDTGKDTKFDSLARQIESLQSQVSNANRNALLNQVSSASQLAELVNPETNNLRNF